MNLRPVLFFGSTLLAAAFTTLGEIRGENEAVPDPVRVGVVGLVHGHVNGFLGGRDHGGTIEVVGIAEPDEEVAAVHLERHGIDRALWHRDLVTMLDETRPEAVAVFTSTFDHREVVEACAPRGIHVMVEKPLAVSMEHARAMEAAVTQHKIHLLVNYETTWYRSNQAVYGLVDGAYEGKHLGELRKIVVRDGHRGPVEIGCSEEFLKWLTDPVLNGGGALMDFGCCGANLITWLRGNERPLSVTAVTQQLKPEIYPKVEDEATVILTYPGMQGIIEASWNWPYSRKDMEVYGADGFAHTVNDDRVRFRGGDGSEELIRPPALPKHRADPVAFFAAVVREKAEPDGLSSLENNLIVTEILDAAKQSAKTGKSVFLALPQH